MLSFIIVRMICTAVLLVGVYNETGKCTVIILALFIINSEILAYVSRKHIQLIKAAINALRGKINDNKNPTH